MELAQNQENENREFNAMREHVELLLANGWIITARIPLTLERQGQRSVLRYGVLISRQ